MVMHDGGDSKELLEYNRLPLIVKNNKIRPEGLPYVFQTTLSTQYFTIEEYKIRTIVRNILAIVHCLCYTKCKEIYRLKEKIN